VASSFELLDSAPDSLIGDKTMEFVLVVLGLTSIYYVVKAGPTAGGKPEKNVSLFDYFYDSFVFAETLLLI